MSLMSDDGKWISSHHQKTALFQKLKWQILTNAPGEINECGFPVALDLLDSYSLTIERPADIQAGWWFGTFFVFPCIIENHHPNWLIFFRGIQTTNQQGNHVFCCRYSFEMCLLLEGFRFGMFLQINPVGTNRETQLLAANGAGLSCNIFPMGSQLEPRLAFPRLIV